MFGDEVMAAALIDRRVHHCHLVTIRGNATACVSTRSCGRRCTRKTPSRPPADAAPVRRWRRPEARPLADLSDFQPAEVSDFGPALTEITRSYTIHLRASTRCASNR